MNFSCAALTEAPLFWIILKVKDSAVVVIEDMIMLVFSANRWAESRLSRMKARFSLLAAGLSKSTEDQRRGNCLFDG